MFKGNTLCKTKTAKHGEKQNSQLHNNRTVRYVLLLVNLNCSEAETPAQLLQFCNHAKSAHQLPPPPNPAPLINEVGS